MSVQPRALVLNAPGINCNLETGFAIEQAGGIADQVQIARMRSGDVSLDDYQILALSGGFSHGDDIASGRILGLELRTRFGEDLDRFVGAGKAVIGICNGMQVLVESGLLPDGRVRPPDGSGAEKRISMVSNANNTFEDRWNRIRVQDSVSKLIPRDLNVGIVEMPSAHQEGRIAARDIAVIENLVEARQVVFRFVDDNGQPTEEYPANPNGSPGGITGLCDPSGVVLGMMPHPERAVNTKQHPNWRRGEGKDPFGVIFFKSVVDYARQI